jgi:adenine phosphoribosyltransferase
VTASIKSLIRTIPDFPKPGIRFRDITPLIGDPSGLKQVTAIFADRYHGKVDKIVGIEARGFIFGAALAHALGVGFVPIRKPGKLPGQWIGQEYALEYGTNKIEIHVDAVSGPERCVLVDDLLATGGTALAAASLLQQLGGTVVECAFVVDLADLPGRKKLQDKGHAVFALCEFVETE